MSQNPMDFVSAILYTRRGIAVCEQLANEVAPHLDILVQDVDALTCERPPWLRGVPTVVSVPDYNIYTGSQAVAFLQAKCAAAPQGAQTSTTSVAPVRADQEPRASAFDDLFSCSDVVEDEAPVSNDARYADKPREKIPASTLEDMLRQRGAVGAAATGGSV